MRREHAGAGARAVAQGTGRLAAEARVSRGHTPWRKLALHGARTTPADRCVRRRAEEHRCSTRAVRVAAGLAGMAALLLPALAAAQAGRSEVEAGNRLYEEGRFEEAHEQYLEALRAAPDSPVVPFNNGNALYRTDEFQRAMEAYQEAAESGDPAVEAQAWYNLGNALYRQQQLQPALEAYKQALRRNPADVDAKHNLELTLEQMQEQQQQQQQSSDQQDENDDENQENQQEQQEQEQQQPPDGQQEQQEQEQQNQPEQEEQEQEENQQQEQGQQQDQQGQQDPPQSGEEPQPQPGELSREDAERLLEAIDEDPDQIQRRRRTTAPARPPRRPW